MSSPVVIKLLMLGWLWPAGGDGERLSDVETIGSLAEREIVVPETPAVSVGSKQALEHYRRYLELPEGDPASRLEATRRLGDLHMEVGEDAGIEDPVGGADQAYYAEAISVYEAMLERNPDYAKADRVLYQLARAYEFSGRGDAALRTLDRLTRTYPGSELIDEAQFRRGELLFARAQYAAAADAFAAVLDYGTASPFYEQSVYKYGWTQFKLGDYDPGIDAFLNLLELRLQAAAIAQGPAATESELIANMGRADRELAEDTLRVLSLSFSYQNGQASIAERLDARGSGPAYLLYDSLGALYLDKERYLDAADTFAGFVARDPFHADAPAVSARRIEAYRAGRFPTLVLEAKEAFVDAYGMDSDYWAFHLPAERPQVVTELKTHLSDLAQYDHAAAQASGEPAAYARAAGWYKRFLAYFPADPDSAHRSFLLGEILTESQQHAEAAHYYEQAAYQYPGYAQAADAAYAGLLARRSHLETLDATGRDGWADAQQRAALRFATAFPQHEQSAPVLANAAEQFFAAGRLPAAIVTAGELLGRADVRDPQLRRVAWTVTAHGHFDAGHFPRAERAYVELRASGGNGDLRGAELDDRIAAAVYRQAEAARAANDVDTAVGHFTRVASVAPLSAIRADAAYDAATLLLNAERWDDAVAALTRFRSTYPDTAYGDEITQKLAVAYERAGRTAAAAQEYTAVAELASVAADVRREAAWQAATLYESGGDVPAARKAWATFVQRYPQPLAEAFEVRQKLADLAGAAGDSVARTQWLEALIEADATAGKQRTPRTRTLAARATLELAEPLRLAYGAVELKAPLADSLKLKKKRLEAALSAYDDAAAYNVADVTTVATFRIAGLYRDLGASLMDSERPGGLNEEELEQYEILLEEQAFPFEEKAIELYEVNAARAADGIYDDWVAKSFAELAKLMPARYARFEKAEDHVATLL